MDISKLLKFKEDDKLAIYEEIARLNEGLANLKNLAGFDFAKLTHLKGDKGKDGYTPAKGVDFFTEEDINDFVDIISDRLYELVEMNKLKKGIDYFDGPPGERGEQGAPGKDADINEIRGVINEELVKMLDTKLSSLDRTAIKGLTAKGMMEEYRKLPRKDKISWSEMFREEGNPFGYNQVAGAGSGTNPVFRTATFVSEVVDGTLGASRTVDWNSSPKQALNLTDNTTVAFTAPTVGVTNLTLRLVQDATGSRLVSWPVTVKWAGGVPPTLTTTASGIDIITFYWNGTNYYGVASLAFA